MPNRRLPNRRLLLATVVLAVGLTGCFTGSRARLVEQPPGGEIGQPSGDPIADAVLTLLEQPIAVPYTAHYDLVRKLGDVTTAAIITSDGSSRRSATIGTIRFLSNGSDQTCNIATGVCESGLLEARVSDTGFTSGFDRVAVSRRLRTAVSRKVGPTAATNEVIAGLPTNCVSIPVGAGAELYCALATGGLARSDGADLHTELTAYENTVTESLFNPT